MKLRQRLVRSLQDRVGWDTGLQPFLFKDLPPKTGWSATLGSLSVVLFLMMFVSGIFLAMHYNPSPDKAYQSIDYIMNDLPAGWLLRGIHHWGASAMVIAVFVHMMSCFFAGSYKKPRELTWISGVIMLLIVLGLGFTGYLLPWDLKAFWATTVSTNIPKDIPLIGHWLSRLALGGDSVSGSTLTRFYAIHIVLLPALLIGLIALHIYLVRAHGISEPSADEKAPAPAEPAAQAACGFAREKRYRFYPEHLFRASIVFTVTFVILIALSIYGQIPREPVAGTQVDNYLPRPEWYYMWLFQLLTFFPGKWEAVGSLLIPFLLVTLLFALPFFDRHSRKLGTRNRPLPLAVGTTLVVGIVYLTMMGFAGARPYGQTLLVPDRPLSASEQRGLYLYIDRECSYCHQINGQGGHRVGPDFTNTTAKGRTREYLGKYIRDPKSINSASVMPKYDLPQADLDALADFLLALDFAKHPARTVTKAQVLGPDRNRLDRK
jgi:quinol-cytochrome oxidoreductase complex cytochrome b subunit